MNSLTVVPPPIPVPVDLAEKFPTDDQAAAALERLGMVNVDVRRLGDKRLLGEYARGAGVVKLANGEILLTQHQVDGVMQALASEVTKALAIEKPRERSAVLCNLAKTFGYITSKKTELLSLAIRSSGQASRGIIDIEDEFIPTVKSFAPGAEVKPNQTLINARDVHIHSSEAPKTAK